MKMEIGQVLTILIGMFFSFILVAGAYFVALILFAVFLVLDKRYGSMLSNYKQSFFLFDAINLIGIIAVIYYEFAQHSPILNTLLIVLTVIKVFVMVVDAFVIKNKNLSNNEYVLANTVQLCSMICILTYFFNVSNLFFAVDALMFEIAAFALKIYINRENKPKVPVVTQKDDSLEERIHSAGNGEGDVE